MYISKEITTHYGIPITYHALNAIHIHYDQGISHIDIAGYFSKEAFENGASAFEISQIQVNQTVFATEKDIYNAILTSNAFKDGVLCEE